jgi:hypothetical protein
MNMPRVSLTDFVDVVSIAGTPKATKIRQIRNRPPYQPAFDFYKRFREDVVGIHKVGEKKARLDMIMTSLTEAKKEKVYPELIAGYKKWWGRKQLQWVAPPANTYHHRGVEVTVNPELGLRINGAPHIIKLYLKAGKLTKNRIDVILHLMETSLPPDDFPVMGVLDVRNAKLHSSTRANPQLGPMVDAELAYIAALWSTV